MKTIYCSGTSVQPDSGVRTTPTSNGATIPTGTTATNRPCSVRQGELVQQAIDHLRMADHPTNPQTLLQTMMQEEAISSLMQQVEGKQLVEAPQEVKEEYQRRTLISFLTEVMPDQKPI